MEADDDPEKRIRELERELADLGPAPYEAPPLKGDAPPYPPPPSYPAPPSYTGDAGYTPPSYTPPTYGPGYTPPSPGQYNPPPAIQRLMPYYRIFVWAIFIAFIGFIVFNVVRVFTHHTAPSAGHGTGAPLTVAPGGSFQFNGNSETAAIACNQGNIAINGTHGTYTITGHCSSIRVGGYSNNVTVENADTLISNGYGNTVTDHACNSCDLTIASYNNTFTVTGHSTSLRISSYSNKVTVDSVDAITVAGYQNTVTYHSGTPKTTDSGYSNIIRQG
jgi:Protein of unknown function (DUF3060)